ncbi:hypothetical protein [Thalassomonas actiniarum]|uniref:Uncharacterized protein n=1 Tax=Thalassomonas actiniarum TaxID=485447 RepID=A0AAE9YUV1_9GAMM|nr:hypothetical protein [Thalassomonas actiniarum]WDE01551.1 hypothetical protein SG35_013575 [Thalassomonas actiniarum]
MLASHLFTTPVTLVESSQMITTMTKRLALSCTDHKKVKSPPPPLTLAPFDISMIWGPLKHHDPGHLWFRNQIAELAAKLTWLKTCIGYHAAIFCRCVNQSSRQPLSKADNNNTGNKMKSHYRKLFLLVTLVLSSVIYGQVKAGPWLLHYL